MKERLIFVTGLRSAQKTATLFDSATILEPLEHYFGYAMVVPFGCCLNGEEKTINDVFLSANKHLPADAEFQPEQVLYNEGEPCASDPADENLFTKLTLEQFKSQVNQVSPEDVAEENDFAKSIKDAVAKFNDSVIPHLNEWKNLEIFSGGNCDFFTTFLYSIDEATNVLTGLIIIRNR